MNTTRAVYYTKDGRAIDKQVPMRHDKYGRVLVNLFGYWQTIGLRMPSRCVHRDGAVTLFPEV